PTVVLSLEISGASKGQGGLVRWSKISRAAEEPRDVLGEHIQCLARSVAPGNSLCVGREDREIMVPTGWQVPPLHQLDLVRQLGVLCSICFEQLRPFAPQGRATGTNAGLEMLVNSIRNKKFFVLRPTVTLFRQPNFFVAQRLTVSCRGVLFVRRTIT